MPPARRSSGRGCLYALAALAAVVVLGLAVGALLLALGARRLTEEVADLGRTQAEEARDVELVDCATDEDGFMTATLDVTNQSPDTSDYFVEVSFERPGGEELTRGSATVSRLAPGRRIEVEATSSEQPPGDFDCRVRFVDRRSSED